MGGKIRASEGGGVLRGNVKLLEAVEQVIAALTAEIGTDGHVGAAESCLRANAAVGDDLGTQCLQWGDAGQASK